MGVSRWKARLACAVWMTAVSIATAAEGSNYGAALSEIYATYQHILAMREACDRIQPTQTDLRAKAYAAWLARHRALIGELDARIAHMIRSASRSDAEFARNSKIYEDTRAKERRDYRGQLTAQPPEEAQRLCREYPDYLTSDESNLGRIYADEWSVLRQRPLPR